MAAASTEEERQTLADQVETAAVTAISDQGLSIDEYNQVIASARDDADLEAAGPHRLPGCLIYFHKAPRGAIQGRIR